MSYEENVFLDVFGERIEGRVIFKIIEVRL